MLFFLPYVFSFAKMAVRDSMPPTYSRKPDATRQRVSIALQRSLAHAIHARTLRLEQSMALLPPPPLRVPLSSSGLLFAASFG